MWAWSCHVTMCLLMALKVASSGHEDAPPPLPISDHEFPRPTVNPVPYPGVGLWKQPPDDIDVGFVPQKTYAQVRRTSRVVHLPQSDAIESASDAEEVINAPRLREVVKHTQIREVYEEEGFEDNAYDHAGYKKAAEHQSGYKKGDEPENKRWRRQRRKPKVDSQGQQSEVMGMKLTDKDVASDEYEGKGDGAIEGKEMGNSEVENGNKEVKKGRGRGRYKLNSGDGGENEDGNRNYKYGRMMHTMDVKTGVDMMDDKGRRIEEKSKVVEWKRKEKKPKGNFLVNSFGDVIKNQARKRESPIDVEPTEADDGLVESSEEELGSGQGTLEDSFGKEHSVTDRPDKAEYLEAVDEERRLKEEDAIREEEIEQHYLETSADIAKDYVKEDRGIDHHKYPYYKTTKNKHSPLRYAMSSSEIPKKTAGGLEFYDSKDFYHCEEVKGPGKVTPERQKDGQWAGAPRKGIFPRLSGLGDKIDCFKNKYWGKEPLDSPFFKEDENVAVENKKRDTQSDSEERDSPFEDSSGFYADIVGNIRNIEKGTFPETNFDSGGPTTHQQNVQSFEPSFKRPTITNDEDRYQNHRDGEEDDDEEDDDEDDDERRQASETPTYPRYITTAPVYEKAYTNPTQKPPLYKYKFVPVNTKKTHHHIILNILPPIKKSIPKKKEKKLPTKNSYQVNAYPKPNKIKASSYPLYPPLGNENQRPTIYRPAKYYPIHPSQVAEYQANHDKLPPHQVNVPNYATSHPSNAKPSPYPVKVPNYATRHPSNAKPSPYPVKVPNYSTRQANNFKPSPYAGNVPNYATSQGTNFKPSPYLVKVPNYATSQASDVKLTTHPVKLPNYATSPKPSRSLRPIPINYSTPIQSSEEFENIFGLYPPPPNLHFKYQTLTLLAPNTTVAKFRRPETVQSAHASNVVRKYPMVDNMAQETYDVVSKVSNLTELQLKNTTKPQSPNINVKLRVKRSRLYSETKPVREIVDEEGQPKLIRRRKRPRKKQPWRNEDVAVEEERSRSNERNEEEGQEDSSGTTPSRGSYDVHEEVDDNVRPFQTRDYDFPEVDYSIDPNPLVKKPKQYSAHNHRPDDENVDENTSRQPEAAPPGSEESRGRKRKSKRKRKKPKQKNFWRNEESYEINEKEPTVEKYVEWRDLDENTEAPQIEKQMDKVDEVYNREVKTVEKGVEDEQVGEGKRRRRPSKRGRIPKQRPESEEDVDADSKRETRRKVAEDDDDPRRETRRKVAEDDDDPRRETRRKVAEDDDDPRRETRRKVAEEDDDPRRETRRKVAEDDDDPRRESRRKVAEDDDDPRKETRRKVAEDDDDPRRETRRQEVEDDADPRRETRRKVKTTSRPHTTHSSLRDRINGWLSNNKDLEIISLDDDGRKKLAEKTERRDSKPQIKESDEEPDEEASSSEQTAVTVNYPNVSRNNHVLRKPPRKGETTKSERGEVEESADQEESQSKNSREKSSPSDEERYSTDRRRGEPKYKEVESKKVTDDQKNNTHMTIHEEIRLTPLNAPPPIVLTPAEINAKLATLFKDQKYGSRYNAKEPQESVNTLRKLRPDEPDSDEKVDESSEDDADLSTTTTKTTTTTTTTTSTLKPRVRPLFSPRSRGQGVNDIKEVKLEPKPETLRSKTQFSQRARGRSRDTQTTTEKSDAVVEKESQRTRTESNQRTKARESGDVSVREVTRSRGRRTTTVKSNAEVTTQSSTVVKPRSRYRFTTTTKTTPVAGNEDLPSRLDGRKLSRKGRDKSTTEVPAEVKNKDQKKEGSESGQVSKVEDLTTVTSLTPSTTKAPKRIFLFNRPKPTTTIKPDVTTKRLITIERPKKPVDILSKYETTNLTSSTSRHKHLPKIPNADIKKVDAKTPLIVTKTSSTKLTQNTITKVADDKSKVSGESKDNNSKPRQLKNFETRKVTKEEIFTTSYIPQDDDDEEEEAEDDGEENEEEEGDDEYADESEHDDVTYEPFEHPYFKFEQNNEQSKKVEMFETPVSGWGSDHSGSSRNSINGRIQKKGYLKPQESLARQTLATDRTLTYIVDPLTRIGTWVEGRS